MAFSLEILENIVWQVDYDTRRQLLTVSRAFQAATERYFSNWDTYRSTPKSDTMEFLAMYTGHRPRLLREVTVTVQLPTLVHTANEPLACRETREEIQANNEQFTSHIAYVFAAIKVLEERGAGNITLMIETPRQFDDKEQFCDHRRYHSWRLQLLTPKALPRLFSIRTLVIGEHRRRWSSGFSCKRERPLDMRIVPDLLLRLPSLEVLDCVYLNECFPYPYDDEICSHFTRPWEGPWRDTRHSFGTKMAEIANTLPVGIKKAILRFGESVDVDVCQSRALPDLVGPTVYDPFSSGLRVLSQRVVALDLQVCADSGMFWPSPREIEAGAALPTWPELKVISIGFKPMMPSGAWYFQGPGGEGRDATGYQVNEEHYPPVEPNEADEERDEFWEEQSDRYENAINDEFRIVPIDENIEPLLEAFAKVLRRMPMLQKAQLYTSLGWDPNSDMEDKYPDRPPKDDKFRWGVQCLPGVPQIKWQVGDWRPSQALRELFQRNVGREGKELEEEWIGLDM